MGFTKALYYPSIDIGNEEWLKTAVLFWDEIYTIVPISVDHPYQMESTQYLSEAGILKGLKISPNDIVVQESEADALKYLNTNEGRNLFMQFGVNNREMEIDRKGRFYIHNDKLPMSIARLLKRRREGEWLSSDLGFANFYMTLLANKICEKHAVALLTDNCFSSNLAEKCRLDNEVLPAYFHGRDVLNAGYLTQGLLTNLIIQGVKVLDSTPLSEILEFRRRHRDELGLFRVNVAKLTQSISNGMSAQAIHQQIEDIYKDEFLPSYNSFKKSLDSSGIKWIADNLMKISFFSVSATALPCYFGFSQPQALLAGAGISLISSRIMFNQDKEEKIRSSPYSYLISLENKG